MELDIHFGTLHLSQVMPKFMERLPALYRRLGNAYKLFIQDNVEKEQSPDGKRWKPLSPFTAEQIIARGKRKGQKRGFHPILRVTGRMTRLYVKVEADGVKVGTNVEYAPLQQFGGMSDGHYVPARPWLFASNGTVPDSFKGLLYKMVSKEIGRCLPRPGAPLE